MMTHNKADKLASILHAKARSEVVQRKINGQWYDVSGEFDVLYLEEEYRVKPNTVVRWIITDESKATVLGWYSSKIKALEEYKQSNGHRYNWVIIKLEEDADETIV